MSCSTCDRLLEESEQLYEHVSNLNLIVIDYYRAGESRAALSTAERA
jgi:hypothetical protein